LNSPNTTTKFELLEEKFSLAAGMESGLRFQNGKRFHDSNLG